MKKSILLFFLFITHICLCAQSRFGVTVGPISSTTNEKFKSENRIGFYGGIVMDSKLGKSLSFRPQIHYIHKGEKYIDSSEGIYNYIELPLNIVYNIPSVKGNFFIGAGPAIALGINGYWSEKGEPREKIEFGNELVNEEVRKLDFGVNVISGYEFKGGFFLNAFYTIGLRDVWVGIKNKNRVFGFGLGKMF